MFAYLPSLPPPLSVSYFPIFLFARIPLEIWSAPSKYDWTMFTHTYVWRRALVAAWNFPFVCSLKINSHPLAIYAESIWKIYIVRKQWVPLRWSRNFNIDEPHPWFNIRLCTIQKNSVVLVYTVKCDLHSKHIQTKVYVYLCIQKLIELFRKILKKVWIDDVEERLIKILIIRINVNAQLRNQSKIRVRRKTFTKYFINIAVLHKFLVHHNVKKIAQIILYIHMIWNENITFWEGSWKCCIKRQTAKFKISLVHYMQIIKIIMMLPEKYIK